MEEDRNHEILCDQYRQQCRPFRSLSERASDNHDFFELHLERKDLKFREADHTKTVV